MMAHAPLAQNSTGPVQVSNINTVRSPKPQRERRVRARPARKVLTGRPMTELCMAGKRLKCFIDTGSSVSLIKYSAILGLHLASRGRAARALAGISGQGLHTIEERDIMVGIPRGERAVHRFIVVKDCQFPGDVLIGIDFLRRFSFTFQHNSRPSYSFLRIGNIELPVTFTDSPSLGVLAVKVKREEIFNLRSLFGSPPLPGARVRRTVMMPPHSGKFVPATVSIPDSDVLVEGNIGDLLIPRSLCRKTSNIINVWVVNLGHKPVKLRNGSFLSVVTPISEFPQVAAADLQEDCTQLTDDNEPPGQLPALNHLSSLQSDALLALLQSHQSLFDGKKSEVGVVPGIYHSIPTGDAQPIMTRQWRLPQISKQIIREECEKMLDSGVIEPSTSPWLSPIVLVKKRDGSHRFCVDFRRINAVTTSDSYPLPRMEELIDTLGKSKIFTVLDARSAYWSIELTPSDRPKTAFSDGAALWQFRRMPYGLKTAGATYQRMINFILSPTLGKHTLAYLDDVVIHSLDFNTHMSDLAETLALLKGAGFKLNVDKCSFAMDSIKLLGFVVSAEGVAPDPAKVKAINEMQTPRSVKEVRSFLGASGFFRRNIEGYATIAAPLTSLTRKDSKFEWTNIHQQAFEKLKEALVSAPVLRRPDFDLPFEIHSDASGVAVGACLIQKVDGIPHAVAYFSRKLRGPEIRYSATDAEALAVVEAIRAFNAYVYGRPFEVYTDHRPLTFIFKRPTKSARMSRWSHEIASYDCKIVYKQGAIHAVPDLLSRAVAAIDLTNVDPLAFRVLQLEDPICRSLIEFLEGKGLPRARIPASLDDFELKDGVLYHVRDIPSGLVSQLVLPPKVRNAAMKIVHSSSTAAHPGVYRTYKRLQDYYWFPNALQFCRKYVQSCATCQRRKGVARGRAPLAATPLATQPFERVSVDLIELPPARNGDKYILSIIDELTRFVQLVPLADKEAHTVADALIAHYVTLFGPPQTLISDNGGEFTGEYFREVCNLMGIKTRYTTPYNPSSNGLVERCNRVIKDCLSSLCENDPQSWSSRVEYVRLAINSAFHRSVCNQPLYLLTGRECTFPIGMTNHQTRAGHIGGRQLDLIAARDAAVTGTQRVREDNMEAVDRKTKATPELTIGSLVIKKRQAPGKAGGLASRWIGPLRIIKKVGPVSYILRDIVNQTEHRVHRNQIIPFRTDSECRLVTPDGVEEPMPDVESDVDDPLNVLLLGLVRPM